MKGKGQKGKRRGAVIMSPPVGIEVALIRMSLFFISSSLFN